MTPQEFNLQFDIYFNNISSNQAPGLNGYEKSVFLTDAEHQLIKEYFNPRVDNVGGGFDGSQKRQYDFSSLIYTEVLPCLSNIEGVISANDKVDKRSKVYLLPSSYYLSVNEILEDDTNQYSVIPISYSEYQQQMLKPYALPVRKAAWRLITKSLVDNSGKEDGYKMVSAPKYNYVQLEIAAMPSPVGTTETATENTVCFNIQTYGYVVVWAYQCESSQENSSRQDIQIFVARNCNSQDLDDHSVIEMLQLIFSELNERIESGTYTYRGRLYDTMMTMNGFQGCFAPEGSYHFQDAGSGSSLMPRDGKIFTIFNQAPMVEIIGKFDSTPSYKMRYVRKPSPIILEDLSSYGSDITIDGVSAITPCELPEECHQEILERAVALAKIAWQGGTLPSQLR